jgi:hypothetical protein
MELWRRQAAGSHSRNCSHSTADSVWVSCQEECIQYFWSIHVHIYTMRGEYEKMFFLLQMLNMAILVPSLLQDQRITV